MKVLNKKLEIETKNYLEFRDITEEIESFIKESKIKNGNILVYSTHTTLAIAINEKEKGFFEDFKECMEKFGLPIRCF